MSPFLLGSIRLLAGTYALLTVCVNLGFNVSLRRTGDSYFSYFTNLSLIGLVAYLIAAAVQTLCYWKRTREGRSGYPLVDKWPRPFLVLHMVLMSTIATFPIIVTIVFWSLLSTPAVLGTPYLAWSNVSQHILNTVYALFEIFMTNIPPLPWLHLVVCVVLLACYLGVAYVTYATQGFYTYEFLDPSEGPILAAYIVGIAVGEVIVFVIVRYVIALREKLVNRRAATADVSETGESFAGEQSTYLGFLIC
ncbi:hypothetical protein DL96DRAFT_1470179 [Flagelloscypha sp. PMI_526]|nr:hypothetical protein DL96DRAFT_1470179 [Flagelloscypha sp. PMI_526]